MKVLLGHQTLSVGNRINVKMIRVWHKLLKFGWIINEGIACTLDLVLKWEQCWTW
jgi:hypothetical protein